MPINSRKSIVSTNLDEVRADIQTDENVSQFMALTGSADLSCAILYLDMSDGNIETAVNLYIEHQCGSLSNDTTSKKIKKKKTDSYSINAVHTSTFINPQGKDEGSANMVEVNKSVRSPDRTRRMCLIDYTDTSESHHYSILDPATTNVIHGDDQNNNSLNILPNPFESNRIENTSSFPKRQSSLFDDRETFNPFAQESSLRQLDNDRFLDLTSERFDPCKSHDNSEVADNKTNIYDGLKSTINNKVVSETSSLSDMFAPPLDLIHLTGGFQGARISAKKSLKWLLVNIQKDSEFSSYALNRDVWRDKFVEDIIRESYIFWQSMDSSYDGRTYVQHYKVEAFPHVSIIDPRTGMLMWKKEGWTQTSPMTQSMFAEIATDFCSRYSLDKPPVLPHNLNQDTTQCFLNDNDLMATIKPIGDMTEEQQPQYPVRKGIDSENINKKKLVKESNNKIKIISPDPGVILSRSKFIPCSPSVFEHDISSINVGSEPTGLDGVAKILIRMPNGQRLVRRFMENDIVKNIYAFVAQTFLTLKSGKSFELKIGFPPRNLISDVENTILNLRLSGETIIFCWKN